MALPMVLLMEGAACNLSAWAQAPVEIPRVPARARAANISDLRYALHYTLVPHSDKTQATELLRFRLKTASAPLLLDFRDGRVHALTVNGTSVALEKSNGHLMLAANQLRTDRR